MRNGASDRGVSQVLARTRRDFLREAAGVAVGSALFRPAWARAAAPRRKKKVVVVTFGGGARDQETFVQEGQENIPHLMRELIPRSSFFTQVVNRGILGHYVATASLATGVYETFNNFAAVSPESPTVFEYFRKDLKRPSSDAWVVAPSNGFNRIGESSHRSYGSGLGARVILPKRLLTAATSGRSHDYQHLLRDNYETPYYAPELAGSEFELQQLEMLLKLSVDDFKSHAQTLSSPDELSVYIARQLMRQVAPSLLWITLHDIDVAHAGAYSFTSREFAVPIGSALSCGRPFKSEPEYAGRPPYLSCRILVATPTKMREAMASSIIVLVTSSRAPPGCWQAVPVFGRMLFSTARWIPRTWCRRWERFWDSMLPSRRASRSMKSCSFHATTAISNPNCLLAIRQKRARSSLRILPTLQQLPLSFLPGLLRELISFDFKFPAERKARERELAYLGSLPGPVERVFPGLLGDPAFAPTRGV